MRNLIVFLCMLFVQVFSPFLHAHMHAPATLASPGWHIHLDVAQDDHNHTGLHDQHHLASHTVTADTGPTSNPQKHTPPAADVWLLVAILWQCCQQPVAHGYAVPMSDDPPSCPASHSPSAPRAPPVA